MDNTAAGFALKDVRLWAKARIASGLGTPEANYQYMKLIEAVDAILNDLEAGRRDSAPRPEGHLRVVETTPGEGDTVVRIAPLPA